MNIIITYVDSGGAVVSTVVQDTHYLLNGHREAFVHADGAGQAILRGDEEGITWMRGYFPQESEEVVCMKTAYALTLKKIA